MAETLRLLSSTLHGYAARPNDANLDAADLAAIEGVASSEASAVSGDIEKLDEEIKAIKTQREQIWRDDPETLYELIAVFMHRGILVSLAALFSFATLTALLCPDSQERPLMATTS